jgi:predicted phage-related endonuclease
VKTTGAFMTANWDDGVPPKVEIQAQHYLACREMVRAHVAVLIGGQTYHDFTIERDDRAIAALIKIETEFWDRVQERRPPPADASSSSKAALGAVWGDTALGTGMVLPPEARGWLEQRAHAHEAEKLAKALKEEASNLLRQAMEDAEEGWLDGKLVCTLKTVNEVEVAAFTRKAYRNLHIKKGALA